MGCIVVAVESLSHVQLFVTPWTVACQAPRSMGLPRQEYWSGLPFPSPGDALEHRNLQIFQDPLSFLEVAQSSLSRVS